MLIWFEDETSAAHELFAKGLTAAIGDVVSGNDEALTRRHILADLVHFAVDHPPFGAGIGLFQHQVRRVSRPPPGRPCGGAALIASSLMEAFRPPNHSCQGEHRDTKGEILELFELLLTTTTN